jgi:signal transduction histidine kinase
MALEKISGQHTTSNSVEIDELYRALELQIGQKEEFSKQVSEMNRNLEEEREMNEILIKTISHDLANPLTVVNAYMEMMIEGRIAEEDYDKIRQRMRLNLQSAMDMIARIRTTILTKSEAEVVTVVPVELKTAIQRLETLFESRLREKNLTLNITGDLTDLVVLSDENALVEQVFSNILSNAVKFSYANSDILIELRSDHKTISVEFRDYGVGMNTAQAEKLISTRGTNGEEGTGFGLIVMRYFLRKFDAELRIISHAQSDQKGTSFVVVLNRPLPKSPKHASECV